MRGRGAAVLAGAVLGGTVMRGRGAAVLAGQLCTETCDMVYFGHGFSQFGAVALRQAAGHHQRGLGRLGFGQRQDRVDRLLTGLFHEGASVDYHQVGLLVGAGLRKTVGGEQTGELVGIDLVLGASERVQDERPRLGTVSPRTAGLSTVGLGTAGLRTASPVTAGLGTVSPRTAGLSTAGLGTAGLNTANLRTANRGTAGPNTANLRTANRGTAGPNTVGLKIASRGTAGLRTASRGTAGPRTVGRGTAGPRTVGLGTAGPRTVSLRKRSLAPRSHLRNLIRSLIAAATESHLVSFRSHLV